MEQARRGGWTEPDRNLRNYYCVNLDGYQKGSWWQLWTADVTIVGRTGTGIISRLSRSPSKRFSGNAGLHPLSGRKSRTPLHWPIRPVLPLIGRPPRCVVAVGVERLVQVDRRQLVLPVATTIFAGRDGVIIRYGGAVDYRPTSQAIEAETYGRQDTGNGSREGWDERAVSAQVAEWPHCRRRRNRSIGGALGPIPSTGCGRMRLSRCCGMIRRVS